MKPKSIILLVLLVIVTPVLLFLLFAGKPVPEQRDDVNAPVPLVEVVRVSTEPRATTVIAQGTVQPSKKIDVISRVSGQILEVSDHFNAGGFFDSGDMMIQIEKSDYELALVRAQSRLSEAQRAVAQERGQARQAQREWRDLGDDDANALALRKPQLEAAEAALRAAQGEVEQAQLDLERTTIIVPFNAVIAEKKVEVGQFISAGQPVAHIYSTESVEVRVPLTDRQVRLVNLPMIGDRGASIEAEVRGIFGGVEHSWTGQIRRIEASINVASQTVFAVVEVEDPYSVVDEGKTPLPVGLFVEAHIQGSVIDNAVLLPREALKPGNVIYVIRDGKLEFVEAQLLQSNRDGALVTAQLNEGEQVITAQMPYAVPGMDIAAREGF